MAPPRPSTPPPQPRHALQTTSVNKAVPGLLCHPALSRTFSLPCPQAVCPSPSPPQTVLLRVRERSPLTCSTRWKIQLKQGACSQQLGCCPPAEIRNSVPVSTPSCPGELLATSKLLEPEPCLSPRPLPGVSCYGGSQDAHTHVGHTALQAR